MPLPLCVRLCVVCLCAANVTDFAAAHHQAAVFLQRLCANAKLSANSRARSWTADKKNQAQEHNTHIHTKNARTITKHKNVEYERLPSEHVQHRCRTNVSSYRLQIVFTRFYGGLSCNSAREATVERRHGDTQMMCV